MKLFSAPRWQINQWTILYSTACHFAAFTLVMPFLPLYLRQLGIHDVRVVAIWSGILFTVSPLLASLLGPFWGRLADRYGLQAMAIRASLALTLSWLFLAIATNVYHLLAIRVLVGVLGGFGILSIALITETCPTEKTSSAIGSIQAMQVLSAAAGPLIGGVLAESIGIRNTSLVAAGLCLTAVLSLIVLYDPNAHPHATAQNHSALAVRQPPASLRWREAAQLQNFLLLLFLLFVFSLSSRALTPIVPLYIAELREIPRRIASLAGLIVSFGAIAEAASAWGAGKISARSSIKLLLNGCLPAGALSCLAIFFANSTQTFLWVRFLIGLTTGGISTLAYAAASRVIPVHARARLYGSLSSAAMFGGAIGPMLSGTSSLISLRSIFVVNACLLAVAAFVVHWKLVDVPSPVSAPKSPYVSETE